MFFFFFNDTATTEIYTLSLHDALPIYANILVVQFFAPLAYTLGLPDLATFFSSKFGVFLSCLIVLAFVSWVITLGMEGYARIQRICFWLGLGGLVVMLGLLL